MKLTHFTHVQTTHVQTYDLCRYHNLRLSADTSSATFVSDPSVDKIEFLDIMYGLCYAGLDAVKIAPPNVLDIDPQVAAHVLPRLPEDLHKLYVVPFPMRPLDTALLHLK